MNGEQIQNPNTTSAETPYEKMAAEVGEFDPDKQKVSKWNNTWKSRLENIVENPIDETEIANTELDKSLDNKEWNRQIVAPYVYGIYASAQEIGQLYDQYVHDDDGTGLNNSIEGAIKLFSELYGIKQDIHTYLLDKEEYPGVIGKYDEYQDVTTPPSYTFGIGFGEIDETENKKGSNAAAIELMSTIAHEIWHAHQDETIRLGDSNRLRQEKYIKNLYDYKDPETGEFTYHDQLLEDEAHSIQYAVENAIRVYQHDKDAFDKYSNDCANNKAEILQLIRKQEQRLAEKGI